MLIAGAGTLAGATAIQSLAQTTTTTSTRATSRSTLPDNLPPGEPGTDYTPVVSPNIPTLPYTLVDGVKVMHLIAEEFEHEFAPGLKCKVWGYNGSTPGPTIEAVEGDKLRIFVTNKLPEATTVHWHGVLVPSGMDGVGGLTQPAIEPGETVKYEFTLRQHGTQMYHPHFDEMVQIGLGMVGMFIIHPRLPRGTNEGRLDRDFAIMLHEWRVDVGASRPNPFEMTDFNLLTFNGKAYPATDPLVAKLNDRVKIRIGNLGPMDHHPIHLHGYQFRITETDGGQIPPSAQQHETTALVHVGSTRAFEFIADAPGDWAMHCHMTHHVMNQMGHGIPNFTGVEGTADLNAKVRPLLPKYMTMGADGTGEMGAHMGHMKQPPNSIAMMGADGPFGFIDMGGMFTILKVREKLTTYDDPGWYDHPAGTVPTKATDDELKMLKIT